MRSGAITVLVCAVTLLGCGETTSISRNFGSEGGGNSRVRSGRDAGTQGGGNSKGGSESSSGGASGTGAQPTHSGGASSRGTDASVGDNSTSRDASAWDGGQDGASQCPTAVDAGAPRVPFGARTWTALAPLRSMDAMRDTRAYPRVALSTTGRGIVTWAEYDGALYHVWASRYEPGIGWHAAEQLDPPTPAGTVPLDRSGAGIYTFYPDDALSPRAYASPTGDLFVTWLEGVGPIGYQTQEVWVSHFGSTAGWTQAEPCPCGQNWGFDDEGHAISIWSAPVHDITVEVRANRFDPAKGWASPRAIETLTTVPEPVIAVSGNGTAFGAFEAQPGLEVQSYDPGTDQWTMRLKYSDPAGQDIDSINVGVDACGNAMLAWDRVQHGHDLFVAKTAWWTGYESGHWSDPGQVTYGGKDAYAPDPLLRAPSGRAALRVQVDSNSFVLLALESGTAWEARSAPFFLGPNTSLGMTNRGDLLVVDLGQNGTLFAQRYLADSSWDTPVSLGQVKALDLAVLPTGEALLVVQDAIKNEFAVAFLE